MDRLTEFVSKSFDGQRKEESMENNNSKKAFTSLDMSKETLDREALAARTSHEYDEVDVTGDRDIPTSEDDVNVDQEPMSAVVTSSSAVPAGHATVTRDVTRPTAPAVISPSEALLHHRAAYFAHKDSALVSGLSQRNPFGIDTLSAKLQENAAALQDSRSPSSPTSSPPVITIPTTVSTCVSSSVASSSMFTSVAGLSLPYTRPPVSPPCNKGQF